MSESGGGGGIDDLKSAVGEVEDDGRAGSEPCA